jgi:hypothetical protein
MTCLTAYAHHAPLFEAHTHERDALYVLCGPIEDRLRPINEVSGRVDEAHRERRAFVRTRSAVVADLAQRERERLSQAAR